MGLLTRDRSAQADKDPLLPQSTNFDAFVKELADSINRHPLPARTIDVIFGQFDSIHPACNGDWMEFGVFAGGSINKTAGYRAEHCSASCPPVFGFDTFTGQSLTQSPVHMLWVNTCSRNMSPHVPCKLADRMLGIMMHVDVPSAYMVGMVQVCPASMR